MVFRVFAIVYAPNFHSNLAALAEELRPDVLAAVNQLGSELHTVATEVTLASVPVRTRELQSRISVTSAPGNWVVDIPEGLHTSGGGRPIASDELADILNNGLGLSPNNAGVPYKRSRTNDIGPITVPWAVEGEPTAAWIELAQNYFTQITGF